MSASVAASVVGIAAGANALSGGAITNALGFGGSGSAAGGSTGAGGLTNTATYDPYSQYRGQAATELNQLVNNPSLAMAQPGYQQQLQQGLQQSQRGAAASGMLQSGAEANALQQQGQNTFSQYYNSQLANLMQLSGASTSPSAAGLAQQQAANAAYGRQMAGIGSGVSGLSALSGGISGLSGMFGGTYSSGSNNYFTDPTAGGSFSGAGFNIPGIDSTAAALGGGGSFGGSSAFSLGGY